MPYGNCKVYSDGSHFIAIPPTTKPKRRRQPPPEELIEVKSNPQENTDSPTDMPELTQDISEDNCPDTMLELTEENTNCPQDMPEIRLMTKKDYFEELYAANLGVKKSKRRANIIKSMRDYFDTYGQAETYVDRNLARKERNLITRRVRLTRKINLQEVRNEFNYFCTFTYSDAMHTEESFKKKLRTALRHLTERRNWKFVGVWERSPEKHRLHFHGIFYIPEGAMVGELIEVKDYSVKKGIMQTTIQNTYFNERFGRSDFENLNENGSIGEAISYLLKYMEKSGEKIVYGGELPQFFISDVMDEDVVCLYDEETSNKLILYDDFTCWDEGVKVGTVSDATIAQMPKCN
ncbi:MAG: hypothetical protein LUI60_07095 [Clostridia bacterium]|nr:hypothetical protein [Clostridia bacterium]